MVLGLPSVPLPVPLPVLLPLPRLGQRLLSTTPNSPFPTNRSDSPLGVPDRFILPVVPDRFILPGVPGLFIRRRCRLRIDPTTDSCPLSRRTARLSEEECRVAAAVAAAA